MTSRGEIARISYGCGDRGGGMQLMLQAPGGAYSPAPRPVAAVIFTTTVDSVTAQEVCGIAWPSICRESVLRDHVTARMRTGLPVSKESEPVSVAPAWQFRRL
jgi:hypothetical protein